MTPSIRFCPQCGTLASADATQCGRCGARLGGSSVTAADKEPVPQVGRLILTLTLYILLVVGGMVLIGALCAASLTLFAR